MAVHIGRREFLVTISGAGAWPLAVRAQQPALPVIGFVNPASARSFARPLSAFLNGASIPGVFSRARNQLICRCSRRRGWRCTSTSRRPRRSASPSRCPCPAAPMGCLNDGWPMTAPGTLCRRRERRNRIPPADTYSSVPPEKL